LQRETQRIRANLLLAEVAAALKQLGGAHARRARRVTLAERVAANIASGKRVQNRDSLRAFQTLALAREALEREARPRDARAKENAETPRIQSALSHCNNALAVLGSHQNAFAAPRVRVNKKGVKTMRIQFEHLHGDVQTTAKQIAAYNSLAKASGATADLPLLALFTWLNANAFKELAAKTKPGLRELIRPEVREAYEERLPQFEGGSVRIRWNAVQGTRVELTTEKPPATNWRRAITQFVSMKSGLPHAAAGDAVGRLVEQLANAAERHGLK
jgi:hypothetical protein